MKAIVVALVLTGFCACGSYICKETVLTLSTVEKTKTRIVVTCDGDKVATVDADMFDWPVCAQVK